MTLPDFIILGAMKTGTTSVGVFLRKHPAIYMPDWSEVRFFHRDEYYERGLAYYSTYFEDAPEGAVVGEKTPSYLHVPSVPERIARHLPAAKLIAILRNPADRAFSLYRMQRSKGAELRPFHEALRTNPDYIEHSRYHEQIQRYLSYFRREQLAILFYEDLRADAGAFCGSLLRFLEVDDTVMPEMEQNNWTGEAKRTSVTKGLNMAYRFRNALRESPFHWLVSNRLMDLHGRRLRNKISRWNRHPSKVPRLEDEDRRYIQDALHQDIEDLSTLLGRDLSAWLEASPQRATSNRSAE